MSIDANTYEELIIHNVDTNTAQLCDDVSDYLLKTWGIRSISLTVDGCTYEDRDTDIIKEGSDLHKACQRLTSAKEIALKMRSCNGGGVNWRLESCFMKRFTDDAEIKANVTYRSTDYYDTDPGVEMYLYDENGLQRMQYTGSAECVADIKEWYCYTPTLRICDEEQMDNTELFEQIQAVLTPLSDLLGIDETAIDMDWEDYGEIILNSSVRFATKDIPAIKELVNHLITPFDDSNSAEIEFEIYAVPDGEGDYDFASVAITLDGTTVADQYCRF